MRKTILLIALALVATACGSSSGAAPTLSIDSATATGSSVSLVFTVDADGDAATFRVDWGDGAAEAPQAGQGQFHVTHDYAPDATSALIAVEATNADGVTTSATTTVALDPATSTTVADTTTTVAETTTTVTDTTTTVADTTTTTESPTTTTSSTTSTSTTTTTTARQPVIAKFELDVNSGTVIERWGQGVKESDWDDTIASAKVKRHDNSWEQDGIAIQFAIPKAEYLHVAEDAVEMRFDYVVRTQTTYELDSDKSDGNAARIEYGFARNSGGGWAESSHSDSISKDDNERRTNYVQHFLNGWSRGINEFNTNEYLYFWLECEARGPGGILVGSDSECDADVLIESITMTVTGIPQS